MYRNRENLAGLAQGSYEFVCSPTQTAKELFYYTEYIGHAFCTREYSLLRTHYSHFLLMFIVRGQAVVHFAGQTHLVGPNEAFLIDTSQPHIYGSVNDMECLWVHFNAKDFPALYTYMLHLNQGQPVFSLKRAPDFPVRFLRLIDNFASPDQEPEIMVSARLYELLCMLLTNCQDIEYSPVNQAVQFINQHYAQPLSLHQLARLAQLSPSRFSEVFKRVTDCSPYQYVIQTRLHAACQYLNCSGLSVEEIALKVGFSGSVPFINAFKRRYGITPYQCRKRAHSLSSDGLPAAY